MTLNDYFDKIFVINLARRTDRMEMATEQAARHGFTFERFEGHDMKNLGNDGCTASHRGVLELICHHRYRRTLILEDDFQIRHDDMTARFYSMIGEVPDDWELLYLGAGYGDAPKGRVSEHVIRTGYMKTTSSFGITLDLAREITPHIYGVGPIDELYATHTFYNRDTRAFIFQPRLMIQANTYSDIECNMANHGPSMEDPSHEQMV